MTIFEKIDLEIKEALKAGEKFKLTVLRGLKSDFKYKQIEIGKELTEELALEVIASAAKKRRDSIEQFKAGNRQDLADKEQAELEILIAYLPKQMSEEELRAVIAEVIGEVGAESPQQMGLVMKSLMPKVKGKADGKLVKNLVTEILAK